MNWPWICAAVIPCLNESKAIGRLVHGVRAHVPRVIVIDDGSCDDTGAQAAAAGAEVIRQETTQGKGAALCAGWRAVRQRGLRWALCMDGDGQHAASDIPLFLQCAERTGAAMVVGNRMAHAREMPWLRRRVNSWMSRRLSRLTGRTLPDTQNGFRLMNLDFWEPRTTAATHFEIESEVLISYLLQGLRIEFVPVAVIYGPERSKIDPWRDTVRWFRWWRGAADRFQTQSRRPTKPL